MCITKIRLHKAIEYLIMKHGLNLKVVIDLKLFAVTLLPEFNILNFTRLFHNPDITNLKAYVLVKLGWSVNEYVTNYNWETPGVDLMFLPNDECYRL